MNANARPHRRLRIAIAPFLIIGGLAWANVSVHAGAASASSSFPAAGDTITLPVAYEVGQTASTSTTFGLSLDVNDESFVVTLLLDLSSTVAELTDDGGAVVHNTIDGVDVVDAPDDFDDATLADAVGVSYAETFDGTGKSRSTELLDEGDLTASQREAAQGLLGESTSVSFGFPEEPVAVGDTWTTDETLDTNGIKIPVTYELRLTALDTESYTIALRYDTDVDESVDGMDVTGRVRGTGTITGAVDNPLEVSYSVTQDAQMQAGEGESSMTMTMTVTIETTSQSR